MPRLVPRYPERKSRSGLDAFAEKVAGRLNVPASRVQGHAGEARRIALAWCRAGPMHKPYAKCVHRSTGEA
jgi:hypothetical protein